MIKLELSRPPVQGETYSLFGKMDNTDLFYDQLKNAADELIAEFGEPQNLLEEISALSGKKRYLKKISRNPEECSLAGYILSRSRLLFTQNTLAVHAHLKNFSFRKSYDKTLSVTEEQLFLYMFEIELTNRLFKKDFLASSFRIAFLPHCLRDLERTCMSVKDEIDKYCKGCSKHCYINAVSYTLRENGINPYIWMEADLRKMFSIWKKEKKTFGVLGIACIPELINGMRMCRKNKIPVIGIPLDANRCARWMGEFHHNSVDLERLKQLILN